MPMCRVQSRDGSPVLTWSQVLGVGDQVLHGLHHLGHRQVLQDAFAHADDFADLSDCQNTKIKKKYMKR